MGESRPLLALNVSISENRYEPRPRSIRITSAGGTKCSQMRMMQFGLFWNKPVQIGEGYRS